MPYVISKASSLTRRSAEEASKGKIFPFDSGAPDLELEVGVVIIINSVDLGQELKTHSNVFIFSVAPDRALGVQF